MRLAHNDFFKDREIMNNSLFSLTAHRRNRHLTLNHFFPLPNEIEVKHMLFNYKICAELFTKKKLFKTIINAIITR